MPWNFDPIGYTKVFGDGAVATYYMNSITVTVGTIFFTLLFGAMAAWALTEYKFRWNTAWPFSCLSASWCPSGSAPFPSSLWCQILI